MIQIFIIGLVALAVGALFGWLLGGRGAGALKAERDLYLENFKSAICDLERAVSERDSARLALARLEAAETTKNTTTMHTFGNRSQWMSSIVQTRRSH